MSVRRAQGGGAEAYMPTVGTPRGRGSFTGRRGLPGPVHGMCPDPEPWCCVAVARGCAGSTRTRPGFTSGSLSRVSSTATTRACATVI